MNILLLIVKDFTLIEKFYNFNLNTNNRVIFSRIYRFILILVICNLCKSPEYNTHSKPPITYDFILFSKCLGLCCYLSFSFFFYTASKSTHLATVYAYIANKNKKKFLKIHVKHILPFQFLFSKYFCCCHYPVILYLITTNCLYICVPKFQFRCCTL